MSLALVSTPIKTVNGIFSNVNAGAAQLPFEFLTTGIDFLTVENYKVNIDILDSLGQPLVPITFKYSPKLDGTLFLDFSQVLTDLQEELLDLDLVFYLEYWESYTGSPEPVKLQTGEVLSIYAEKQILSEGGSNMWEYLLANTSQKLLTKFTATNMWFGWYRRLSYIIDENITARTGATNLELFYEALDINQQPIGAVNRVVTPASEVGVVENTITTLGVTTKFIKATARNSGTGVPLTNSITYKVLPDCTNPIMVEWINSVGGWDQYLFTISQDFQRKASTGVTSQTTIQQDIEYQNFTKWRLADVWTQSILMVAEDLTREEFVVLAEIKSSPVVRVWLNREGTKFVRPICSARYEDTFATQDVANTFTLQLEMPNNFDFFEGREYGDPIPTEIFNLIDSDQDNLIDSDADNLITT